MTADAKVGLLLGLVFIVMIAFLINGLPGFLKSAPTELVSNGMVQNPQENVLISEKGKPIVDILHPPAKPEREMDSSDVRITIPLDNEVSPERKSPDSTIQKLSPPTTPSDKPGEREAIQPVDAVLPQPAAAPRTYVVQDGDSLAKISLAIYGPDLGKKLATVNAIYEANKNQLESPHKVPIGMKLIIPDLSSAPVKTTEGNKTTDKQPTKPSEPVKASERTLDRSGDKPPSKPATKPAKPTNPDPKIFEPVKSGKRMSDAKAASGRSHQVQPGENLWNIAEKHLGNGNRYREILSLNAGVIHEPDDIRDRMELKLPKR